MQEKALWLLASAAGVALFAVAPWPHGPPPAAPIAQSATPRVAGTFRVAVLNGCGAAQVAARMTRKARTLELDVIDEGNAVSFGFLESVVIDRIGDLARARRVAEALGIPHAIQQISDDAYRLEDVTIIVGRDYERLGLFDP